MKFVHGVPPIYDEICERFPVRGLPVIFAWGDIIFNPQRANITAELLAHEKVHMQQQGSDIVGWWRRYLKDDAFRLDQECPAHVTEYWTYCHRNPQGKMRAARRVCLHLISSRLASDLYGPMIRYEEARRAIKLGEAHLQASYLKCQSAAERILVGDRPADADAGVDAPANQECVR